MRLLTYDESGSLVLKTFGSDSLPAYAILSHTWHEDNRQEVSFQDLQTGLAESKPGYVKIQFCERQAAADGLRCFWIDTCCIDDSDVVELSHAVQSMFHWYRNAVRCYVYLSDVSTASFGRNAEVGLSSWELDFRKSRWFTRGWTLQELLAPSVVDFFSREHHKLGDKRSLKTQIHEVTGIAQAVLEGTPLSRFSINERLRWREHRQTKREEDGAYSLQGIFGVNLAPVYGEGAAGAFRRLMDEVDKVEKCIQDLRSTDSRDDKKRIEDTKGGLLNNSFRWIFTNVDFQQWHSDLRNRLLWVKGDPGKGKTMLLCGIIDELQNSTVQTANVSYFFLQATDSRINSGVAALRGLLYLVVIQQPSLVLHVRKRYDHAGKLMFEDANAWIALTEIFADLLRDPSLDPMYIIIDALDECVIGLPKLLDFIAKQSSVSSRVKWIVSSRNRPDIEERLDQTGHELSLELNAESVSMAVQVYIEHKVSQLAQERRYDERTQRVVLEHLKSNANNTFLWVALVCQDLKATSKRNVRKKLHSFPPGLNSLYEQMMQHISKSDDAEVCKRILAAIALVYRPITLKELTVLVGQLEDITDDPDSIREIIGLCGSLLTLQEETIYFVHQSAKDFLLAGAAEEVFPSGRETIHYTIFARSLDMMSKTLQRDMYHLKEVGYPIENVRQPDPDPLVASRYLCVYWVDHLRDSNLLSSSTGVKDLQDRGIVDVFLRKKYLYWLETLSLCKSIPKAVVSMADLWSLVQGAGDSTPFADLVHDAHRFIMYHKGAIESSPLQTYVSALLFSPERSLVRKLFRHEEPEWLTIKPTMNDSWSACLQTFEGHSGHVTSVAFSHDSTQLVSASDDKTVKIWDASNGACLQTLDGYSSSIRSAVFSHNSIRLASALDNSTIKIWDVNSGTCSQTLKGHSDLVRSVAFSHDSTLLASASYDMTVKIWDAISGKCLQTLDAHNDTVRSVAFSHNSTLLASASYDKTVKIWDAQRGVCLQTLEDHSDFVTSVAFSHDSVWLASASRDKTVKIWDASSGSCLQTLEGHSGYVNSVAFSHDAVWLASASDDNYIMIWDTKSGACLQTLEGHSGYVNSISFSHDSARVASASRDMTVKIWDTKSSACLRTVESHSSAVTSIAFSHDSVWLASASYDNTVKIWDGSSGTCLCTLRVGKALFHLLFDSTNSYLRTEIGDIVIDPSSASSRIAKFADPRHPQCIGAGINLDGTWITHGGKTILWLPSEYRASCLTVCGEKVGIGTGSGRVWIGSFQR